MTEPETPEPTDSAEKQAEAAPSLVDQLKAEHEAALTAMKDQWLRTAAELENTRKRAQRDLEETNKYAVSGFARDMIGVAENLVRALSNISEEARAADPALKTLYEGVDLTRKELLSAFERHGIKRLDPMGEKFDHNFHQAVVQLDVPDTEPGRIVQVLQAGYVIHDRLLRPAMVGVAKKAEGGKKVDTSA